MEVQQQTGNNINFSRSLTKNLLKGAFLMRWRCIRKAVQKVKAYASSPMAKLAQEKHIHFLVLRKILRILERVQIKGYYF